MRILAVACCSALLSATLFGQGPGTTGVTVFEGARLITGNDGPPSHECGKTVSLGSASACKYSHSRRFTFIFNICERAVREVRKSSLTLTLAG
jgi:hypothetical protein